MGRILLKLNYKLKKLTLMLIYFPILTSFPLLNIYQYLCVMISNQYMGDLMYIDHVRL